MYLFKNAMISITRNKGRNILIGIIIIVISCFSTITLAIRNTANDVVEEYYNANEIIGSISFNRKSLMENFKGGEDATKDNIETFNSVEELTIEEITEYGDSEYLKGYYYIYATSLDSDTLTKASDSYSYEVEEKQTKTTTKKSDFGDMPSGGDKKGGGSFGTNTETNTETIITKRTETIGINKSLTGMFEIDGYSSYDGMEEFISGEYKITDGEMISDFSGFECVVNEELAKLNEISVGSVITLKNSNTSKTYEFTVVGIYTDYTNEDDTKSMYSESVNTIITGAAVVSTLASEDESLVTNITPSFVLESEEVIDSFSNELTEKGLNEYYTLSTNVEDLEDATSGIENVSSFATTFLVITLIISAVVLLVINMINIRERKYEIGVFRTIGLSKLKLTLQFMMELAVVTLFALMIGATIGGFASKSVGNYLLENEISEMENNSSELEENFGRSSMKMEFNKGVQINQIDTINTIVDYKTILELLGIGLFLTIVSSIASMISINRFSPLTILKERS